MNRVVGVLLVAVVLPSIGLGLTVPLQPYLYAAVTRSAEASIYYGWSLSLYALMQIVGMPVAGMLSDRFGRRPVFLASLLVTALNFAVMAVADSYALLLAGQVIAGLGTATILSASASIADVTSDERRGRYFGYLAACYGISLVAGPFIGGAIGEHDLRLPFMLAGGLSAVGLAIAAVALPETRPAASGPLDWRRVNPVTPLYWLFAMRPLLPLVILYFVLTFGGQNSTANWVYFTEERFGLTSLWIGLSMAVFGLLHALTQAFLVGPLIARLGEQRVIALGIGLEVAASLALAFAGEAWMLFGLLPLFGLSGIANTALKALMSQRAGADHQGQLLGGLDAVASVAGIVGPVAYGSFYAATHQGWPGMIWLLSAAIYLCCGPLIWRLLMPARR